MVPITIVTGFSSRAVEMELKSHTETGLPCTGFKRIMLEGGKDSRAARHLIYDYSKAQGKRKAICEFLSTCGNIKRKTVCIPPLTCGKQTAQ